MNNLIPIITKDDGVIAVSGRMLHEFLEVKTQYSKWFERMAEYGFAENIDYLLVSQKCPTNNPKNPTTERIDHVLKLDMAKEISMLQRTEKGKMARQYFIEVEKRYNSPEMSMARGLKAAEMLLASQEKLIEEMKPKALFADAVSASKTTILIGDLAKLLKQNGYETGQQRLFKQLRDEEFLIKQKGASWNMPTQKSMDLGLFEVKESTHVNPDGSTRITKTTKVTGKGQTYFINRFLGEKVGC